MQESFVFSQPQTWEEFFGALATSASYAPDEGSALYERFEQAARQAFERFSTGGVVASEVETKLYLGRTRFREILKREREKYSCHQDHKVHQGSKNSL